MTLQLAPPDLSPVQALDSAYMGMRCVVVSRGGAETPLALPTWLSDPDDADRDLFLDRCVGPTIDIGCGPGRLTADLTADNVPAMGIDISREAVRMTRRRGAHAEVGDVFAPGLSRRGWRTALLADGNIGIGGDPTRLLRRVRELLAPGGTVLVELGPPGTGLVCDRLRLRLGDRESTAFDWAFVGVDAIDDLADAANLSVVTIRQSGRRFVGVLTRADQGSAGGHVGVSQHPVPRW